MAEQTKKAVYRSKGGILNDSDGIIQDYQFTVEPPFFKNEGRFYHLVLTIKEDGRDEPTMQPFFLGGDEENRVVSEDGHTLSSTDDKSPLSPGTASADLFESYEAAMDAAGADGGVQVDTGDDAELRLGIIGARVRFIQQPLNEAELADRKRRGMATVRKDKNDPKKTWPLTKTLVSKFYGFEAVVKAKPAKPAKAVKGAAAGPMKAVDVQAMLAQRRATA